MASGTSPGRAEVVIHRQRGDVHLVLVGSSSGSLLVTRRRAGGSVEQHVDELGDRVDEVLAVVEDQQDLPVHEQRAELIRWVAGAGNATRVTSAMSSTRRRPSVTGTRSTNQTPSGKLLDDLGGHGERQHVFPVPPIPTQAHQRSAPEQCSHLGDVGLTTEQLTPGTGRLCNVPSSVRSGGW